MKKVLFGVVVGVVGSVITTFVVLRLGTTLNAQAKESPASRLQVQAVTAYSIDDDGYFGAAKLTATCDTGNGAMIYTFAAHSAAIDRGIGASMEVLPGGCGKKK